MRTPKMTEISIYACSSKYHLHISIFLMRYKILGNLKNSSMAFDNKEIRCLTAFYADISYMQFANNPNNHCDLTFHWTQFPFSPCVTLH